MDWSNKSEEGWSLDKWWRKEVVFSSEIIIVSAFESVLESEVLIVTECENGKKECNGIQLCLKEQ